jgi:hypothetical protein
MRHSNSAWLAVTAGVLWYELTAPQGELLSEAVDRYRTAHPVITTTVVVYLAGHLLRLWPRPVDPLHQVAVRIK